MRVCHVIEGNRLRLDGGAMFGNAPRALWDRWCIPDAEGRIELASRCLLVREPGRSVLFEAGAGALYEPSLRARYGIDSAEHATLRSLAAHGVSPGDVDVVVLSHLHFDHAGGLLTRKCVDSEPELAFPRAHYVVSASALERARAPHVRDRASFVPGLVDLLLDSRRVEVLRDAAPGPLRSELLGPDYAFETSHGHTPGMLHACVRGARASVFYCADLIPGVPWLHLPITMGYDRFPEQLVDEKRAVLESRTDRSRLGDSGASGAALQTGASQAQQHWLFFTHDTEVAAARVGRDDRGRFVALDPHSDFGPGLDLERGRWQ